MARTGRIVALVALAAALTPAHALAVPPCGNVGPIRAILDSEGALESVIADGHGRLIYTNSGEDQLMRLDRPGALPRVVAGVASPGGLLLEADGESVIVGQGTSILGGALGNVIPMAKLLRVSPTGKIETLATGLQMANGLARLPDGTIFASSDVGLRGGDRVTGDRVERGWVPVYSANGLAVDRGGRYLFANQTFAPAAIARVSLRTGRPDVFARPPGSDFAAGLDGMTIDERDRLFVVTNAGGEVWRVDTDGSICSLASGLSQPSALAFGSTLDGTGFAAENLYVVGFDGNIVEVANARPRPAVPLPAPVRNRLTVRPRRVRAGERVRLRFAVTPPTRVKVRFRGRTVHTNLLGRARVRVRFRKRGRVRVRAFVPGRDPRATIQVLPPR